jgi:hypothetical protein
MDEVRNITRAHVEHIENRLDVTFWSNFGEKCERCGNEISDEGDC